MKAIIETSLIVVLLVAMLCACATAAEKLVTVELKDATIAEALDAVFKDSGFTYTLDSEVKGTVTVNFKDTQFNAAVETICRTVNPPLAYTRTGTVYEFKGKPDASATAPVAVAPPIPTTPAPPVAVEPPTAAPPIPQITPELSIIKRTPTLDGQMETGEWDTFFSFNYGDAQASACVNWDDDNLYVGMKSSVPADLLVTLDANGDGWFHGPDNYEFVVRRGVGTEAPSLSVSRYDSRGTPGAGGAPLAAAEASAFKVKASSTPESCVYELAIPRVSTNGLILTSGRKIGLKVAVGLGGPEVQWIPPSPLGEVLPVELVAIRSTSASSLTVTVDVRDRRLAPGEELVSRIKIKNKGAVQSAADTIVIGGEGKTSKILGSQLIRIDGINPGKTYSTTFRTPIPKNASLGSGALGVEVRAGQERLAGELYSFDIVPAYEAKLDIGTEPVKKVGYYRVAAVVKNNTQNEVFGKVRITLPDGWEFIKSGDTKEFRIPSEDSAQEIVFRVKPSEAAAGKGPITADVLIGKETLQVKGTIEAK